MDKNVKANLERYLRDNWHYGRNLLNKDRPTFNEVRETDGPWLLLEPGETVFHQHGPGNENNLKFVTRDGYEAVFNPDGTLVTSPENMGTFNYVDDGDSVMGHVVYDVRSRDS